MNRRWIPILAALCVLALNALALACPMCKDSIPSTDASQPGAVPSGFNYSVYTLLIGVFAVAATVCGMIFKVVRESTR
jgi:hypothetical protein